MELYSTHLLLIKHSQALHYDIWKETSSVSDLEGTYGLEFPILVNRINLGNKDSFSYSPESKINYSLGFDLINFINYGNNYFGLLGEYNYTGNQIRIQPINVSFSEGRSIASVLGHGMTSPVAC